MLLLQTLHTVRSMFLNSDFAWPDVTNRSHDRTIWTCISVSYSVHRTRTVYTVYTVFAYIFSMYSSSFLLRLNSIYVQIFFWSIKGICGIHINLLRYCTDFNSYRTVSHGRSCTTPCRWCVGTCTAQTFVVRKYLRTKLLYCTSYRSVTRSLSLTMVYVSILRTVSFVSKDKEE